MREKTTVKLELLDIQREPLSDSVESILLQTNDGVIPGRYRPAATPGNVVLWAAGAIGGLDGPAGGLYKRLAAQLVENNIASFQLDYRKPGALIDSVLDVLIAIGFLRNENHSRVTLVGHSYGGPVVINAGVASPAVAGVATLSTQMMGADDISELSPRPVLLIHGDSDDVRSEIGSHRLFELAAEPKELIIYPGCGHELNECSADLDRDLLTWLRRVAPISEQTS